VYRLALGAHQATVYAQGLTAITGIAFGPDGKLYVSEWTTGFGKQGPLPIGDIVAIPKGGGTAGRQVLGQGVLHFSGGVGVNGARCVRLQLEHRHRARRALRTGEPRSAAAPAAPELSPRPGRTGRVG
jgi:hypothetical protein